LYASRNFGLSRKPSGCGLSRKVLEYVAIFATFGTASTESTEETLPDQGLKCKIARNLS